MKSFVVAVALLLAVTGFAVGNAFFVETRVESLLSLGEADRSREALEELTRQEPYLSLTVHHVQLESLQTAAEEMCIYPKDASEYRAAKARFLSGCREILAGEKFTFFNLF